MEYVYIHMDILNITREQPAPIFHVRHGSLMLLARKLWTWWSCASCASLSWAHFCAHAADLVRPAFVSYIQNSSLTQILCASCGLEPVHTRHRWRVSWLILRLRLIHSSTDSLTDALIASLTGVIDWLANLLFILRWNPIEGIQLMETQRMHLLKASYWWTRLMESQRWHPFGGIPWMGFDWTEFHIRCPINDDPYLE